MDEKAQLLVALMGAGGGGAALLAFVNGMFKWLSGAAHRERAKITSIDKEIVKRREAEEHVSILKRQLLENGITPRERAQS